MKPMRCGGCNEQLWYLYHPESRRERFEVILEWDDSGYYKFVSFGWYYNAHRRLECNCGHHYPRRMFRQEKLAVGRTLFFWTRNAQMELVL